MVVDTANDRVRHSRRLVLELLGSSVDLSTTPQVPEWLAEYGAEPDRFGEPATYTGGQRARLDPGAKVPVALFVHGGPQGSWDDDFHYRWNPQVFAGAPCHRTDCPIAHRAARTLSWSRSPHTPAICRAASR